MAFLGDWSWQACKGSKAAVGQRPVPVASIHVFLDACIYMVWNNTIHRHMSRQTTHAADGHWLLSPLPGLIRNHSLDNGGIEVQWIQHVLSKCPLLGNSALCKPPVANQDIGGWELSAQRRWNQAGGIVCCVASSSNNQPCVNVEKKEKIKTKDYAVKHD